MDRNLLKRDLILDEDKRQFPYPDTRGKLTIGIGRNLEDDGLSDSEINFMYENDANKVEAQLNHLLSWWTELTEPRQRVLANMCFELGIDGLLRFKNTLALIHAGEYEKASEEMLQSLWARQVPNRAKRLAQIMKDGK